MRPPFTTEEFLDDRPPRSALVVLMAWALVASTAVLAFGMWEDIGVTLAALAVIIMQGGASPSRTDPEDDAAPTDGPVLSTAGPGSRARLIGLAAVVVTAAAAG